MRFFVRSFIFFLAAVAMPASAQVAPNSDFHLVQNFWYQDGDGHWTNYRAAFFSAPRVNGVTPQLWLLPHISVDNEELRYSDAEGNTIRPRSSNASSVFSISVPISYRSGLPNEPQQVAIGAALSGQVSGNWYRQWPTDQSGFPQMWAGMIGNFQARQVVQQAQRETAPLFAQFQQHLLTYQAYNTRVAALNEVRVVMLIDGEEVASRSYPGSLINFGNTLPRLTVRNPSVYEVNKIRNGEYEVYVSFRFRDAQTSFVNGRFNAKLVVDQFIRESQRVRTRRSSSGFQIMGIGNRRNRLKTSMTQNFESNTDVEQIENTTIVSFDANDEMMRRFEEAFFPSLSRDRVIESHIAAAEAIEANPSSNQELAQIHRQYAAAMRANDPSLEVDMEKAAAALAAQDYASFLAHGVRFSNSDSQRTDNFRRVISNRAEIEQRREWTEFSQRSVQRQTTIPLELAGSQTQIGNIGFCGGAPWGWREFNNFGQWRDVQGIMLTCLMPDGALAKAGFAPGMVIVGIDGSLPSSLADFDNILRNTRAGQRIRIDYVSQFVPQGAAYNQKWVELTKGRPVE